MGLGLGKINILKVTQQFVQVTQGRGRFNNYQGLAAIWGFITNQPVPVDGPNPTTLLATEAEAELIVGAPIKLTTCSGLAGTNTFVNPFDIHVRVNGVTVATLTIPAGDTTLQSVAVNTVLAAGDRIAYLYDSAAGAGGVDDLKIELEYDGEV